MYYCEICGMPISVDAKICDSCMMGGGVEKDNQKEQK